MFRQGPAYCGRGVGTSQGYVRLGRRGQIRAYGTRQRGAGASAVAITPDGSVLLLIEPLHYWQEPEFVEELRPDGTPDTSFGEGGKVKLGIPKEAYVDRLAVTNSGEILVGGANSPEHVRKGELIKPSLMLIGLRPDGAADPRFGPHGIAEVPIPDWTGFGGLWLDTRDRVTITAEYRPAGGPKGLAAARFVLGR